MEEKFRKILGLRESRGLGRKQIRGKEDLNRCYGEQVLPSPSCIQKAQLKMWVNLELMSAWQSVSHFNIESYGSLFNTERVGHVLIADLKG